MWQVLIGRCIYTSCGFFLVVQKEEDENEEEDAEMELSEKGMDNRGAY